MTTHFLLLCICVNGVNVYETPGGAYAHICTCVWRPEASLECYFFVVIHLVLCVCFYELVSHWLIWGIPIMTVWLAREPKRSSCLTSPVLGLQVTATSPSFSNSDPGDQTQVLVITQQVHYWPSYLTPAPSYNIIPLKFMFSVHPFCPLPTQSAWVMPYSSPMDPEASLS